MNFIATVVISSIVFSCLSTWLARRKLTKWETVSIWLATFILIVTFNWVILK